jgi:hypothetical protein
MKSKIQNRYTRAEFADLMMNPIDDYYNSCTASDIYRRGEIPYERSRKQAQLPHLGTGRAT